MLKKLFSQLTLKNKFFFASKSFINFKPDTPLQTAPMGMYKANVRTTDAVSE